MQRNASSFLKAARSWPVFGKRLTTTTAASGQLNLPHYREKSALFIPPPTPHSQEATLSVFQRVIMPELDLDNQLGVGDKLQGHLSLLLNLKRRGGFNSSTNMADLRAKYSEIKLLRSQIESLEASKQQISAQINGLIKATKQKKTSKEQLMQSDEFKKLHDSGNAIKLDMNKIQEVLIPLETEAYLACLGLPNQLHAASLLPQTEPIFSFKEEVKTPASMALAKATLLPDVQKDSLLSKYYIGRLAKIEQALVNYFYSKLQQVNEVTQSTYPLLEPIKSVSMFKSAIIEGCGQEFRDSSKLFNVMNANLVPDGATELDHSQHVELLHLTGACSLASLIVSFVRTQINAKHLPWTVYTNAKSYSPLSSAAHGDHGQSNNFDMLSLFEKPSELIMNQQNSTPDLRDEAALLQHYEKRASAYISQVTEQLKEFVSNGCQLSGTEFLQTKSIDKYLVDVLKLLIHLYRDLNIPLKFQLVPSDQLALNECLAIQVHALSPLDNKYHVVSR